MNKGSGGYPKDVAEAMGLYVLCSANSSFPRDITKGEHPDWYWESSIGLEMARAFEQKDWEQFIDNSITNMKMSELVKYQFQNPGYVVFTADTKQGKKIMCYDVKERILECRDPYWKYRYDELKQDVKDRLAECPIEISRPGGYEENNPYAYVDLVSWAFEDKVKKLNSPNWNQFNEDYLFIEVLSYSDLRGMKKLVRYLSNLQSGFTRHFSKLYIWFPSQGEIGNFETYSTLIESDFDTYIMYNYLGHIDKSVVQRLLDYRLREGHAFTELFEEVPVLSVKKYRVDL